MKKTIATAVLVVFMLLFGFFAISNQVTLQTTEYRQEQVQEVEQEADSLTTFRQAVRLNNLALLSSDDDDLGDSYIEEGNKQEGQDEQEVTPGDETGNNENEQGGEVVEPEEPKGDNELDEKIYCECEAAIDENEDGICDTCEKEIKKAEEEPPVEPVDPETPEVPEEHVHEFIDVEAKDATCTEIGYTAHKACDCGEKEGYEEIEALGHTFTEYEVTVEATCTKAGEQKHTCTVCEVEEVEVIEAFGHAELDEEGYCTRCGGKDVEYIFAEFVFAKIGLGKFYADYAMWISIVSVVLFAVFALATGYVIGHKYVKGTKPPKQKKEKLTKREKAQRDYRAPAARRGGDNNGPKVHF